MWWNPYIRYDGQTIHEAKCQAGIWLEGNAWIKESRMDSHLWKMQLQWKRKLLLPKLWEYWNMDWGYSKKWEYYSQVYKITEVLPLGEALLFLVVDLLIEFNLFPQSNQDYFH